VLSNAERLQRLSGEAYSALYDSDDAALTALNAVWKRVAELASLDPRLVPYLESRDTITSQLEDLAFFLRGYADDIDASPGRLQEVEDRLAVLERLKRKYGPSLDDVLRHRDTCARELESLERIDERTAELKTRLESARRSYLEAASILSVRRRQAALQFSKALEAGLAELAMSRTRFEVQFNQDRPAESAWTARGIDAAEFLVSPNPGEELRPLARIASGGELSRIMLALRSLSAGATRRATLIFDEVDAGIGGRAADDVGRKLQRLGQGTQVLCITHLPQIAACGTTHFQVSKRVAAGRTVTSVTKLSGTAREEELARMMAGGTLSKGVLASAAELLSSRQAKGEPKAKGESETRRMPNDSLPRRASARPAGIRDRK
jgi:DNA repair protein RecN (Recombination protein N)